MTGSAKRSGAAPPRDHGADASFQLTLFQLTLFQLTLFQLTLFQLTLAAKLLPS